MNIDFTSLPNIKAHASGKKKCVCKIDYRRYPSTHVITKSVIVCLKESLNVLAIPVVSYDAATLYFANINNIPEYSILLETSARKMD
jgi:hypothetical protein